MPSQSLSARWQQRGAVDGERQSELGLNLGIGAHGPLGSGPRGVVAPLRSVDDPGSTARDASRDRVGGVSDHLAWTLHRPAAGGLDPLFQGWRLDPILQFGVGLLVMGTLVEAILRSRRSPSPAATVCRGCSALQPPSGSGASPPRPGLALVIRPLSASFRWHLLRHHPAHHHTLALGFGRTCGDGVGRLRGDRPGRTVVS